VSINKITLSNRWGLCNITDHIQLRFWQLSWLL